jgi:outer membrane murein-binding lipoprotein Lpp
MSLDGLRAWIGVVERKLTMRTRVFLVLVAIAIGGAGAGIYLAIDANDSAVSEADLQAVRDELATSATETAGGDVTQLETEVEALQAEVEALQSEPETGKDGAATAPQESAGDSARQGSTSGGVTPQPQQQDNLREQVERSGSGTGK